MSWKVSSRKVAAVEAEISKRQTARAPVICPLCLRPIPTGVKSSRHHLVPRLKGGTHKGTVELHQICHSAIHARFSETELARDYASMEALRAAPQMQDFLGWIAGKPAHLHARTRKKKR